MRDNTDGKEIMLNKIMLGERLRFYRKEKGLSQMDLSKLSGVSRGYISIIENANDGEISLAKLSDLATALEITLDHLLCDSLNIYSNRMNNNPIINSILNEVSTLSPTKKELIVDILKVFNRNSNPH